MKILNLLKFERPEYELSQKISLQKYTEYLTVAKSTDFYLLVL